MPAVTRFEGLIAWQKARVLARDVYLVTQTGRFARDFDSRVADFSGRKATVLCHVSIERSHQRWRLRWWLDTEGKRVAFQ